MALTPKLSNAAASAAADGACALCNSGFLDLYDGVQPATADTVVTTQVKLARLTFGATAFGAAVNGVATANAIGNDTAADASGTASWCRARQADESPVFDGSAGVSDANLVLTTLSIFMGAVISVTSFTYTQQKG